MYLLLLSFLVSVIADDTLFWGPYKPDIYFGMRPRQGNTFDSGLLWFNGNNISGLGNIRHDTENTDSIKKFAWTRYDPRIGGRQVIEDVANGVNLTTDLVKSEDGKAWEVRISGKQSPDNVLSLIYYAGLEANGNDLGSFVLDKETTRRLTLKGVSGDLVMKGKSSTLGEFTFKVTEGNGDHPTHRHEYSEEKPSDMTHYCGLITPEGTMWRAREIIAKILQEEVGEYIKKYDPQDTNIPIWSVFSLNNKPKDKGNSHFIQKTFKGDFEFTVSFVPKGSEEFLASPFAARFKKTMKAIEQKFDSTFTLNAPFDQKKYKPFAMEMLSSVLGGIGFFHGNTYVKGLGGYEATPVRSLFTGTPSRPFFPRGFYWDEGFNLLAMKDYDQDLVMEIIESWFDTMDEDGYIQREQILGDAGRTRVPQEFVIQDPEIANPPTMLIALSHLNFTKKDTSRLEELYPKLQKHFQWFRRSQKGEYASLDREYPSKEVYRWRGRTKTHLFSSGLDDYPRAEEISDGEVHVDLMAWMGAAARSLSIIANKVGDLGGAAQYDEIVKGIQANLEAVHWNAEEGIYCDIALDEFEEDYQECHRGYVGIMPFLLKLAPDQDSERTMNFFSSFAQPDTMLSETAGIRSLSLDDELYGTGENYWRGAVWYNMNYLLADALLYYGGNNSPSLPEIKDACLHVYTTVRKAAAENIFQRWLETGTVWESYDGETGEPRGAKSFTGWSALAGNVMCMPKEPNFDADAYKKSGDDEFSHAAHDTLTKTPKTKKAKTAKPSEFFDDDDFDAEDLAGFDAHDEL